MPSTYRNALSTLLAALDAGLAPDIAASQLSSIADERLTAQQARRGQMASLTEQLLGLAGSGQPLAAADTYLDTLSSGGVVGPRMADRLSDVLEAAYGVPDPPESRPLGEVIASGSRPYAPTAATFSPLATPAALMQSGYLAPPEAASEPMMLDSDDLENIELLVDDALAPDAQGRPAEFVGGDYHQAWMGVANRLRALGYPQETIDAAHRFFDQTWASKGGPAEGTIATQEASGGDSGGLLRTALDLYDVANPLTLIPRRLIGEGVGALFGR